MVTRKEDQCGVGGEGVALCIIRESETGLCRTWYVKSWFDMVRIYSLTEWLIAIHVCNIYKKP